MKEIKLEQIPNDTGQPFETTSGAWRIGLRVFAAVFLFRGLTIALAMTRSGRFFAITSVICAIYLACGLGLFLVTNWGRILTLASLPLLALNALFIVHMTPRANHAMPIALICVYGILVVYLMLPRVRQEFPSTKVPRKSRDFLAPPPRRIPLSLKLSTIFGDKFMIMAWVFPGFIFTGIGIQLKEPGFIFGPDMDWPTALLWLLNWLLMLGVATYMSVRLTRMIRDQYLRLLEHGLLGQAILSSRKEIHLKHTLYRLVFTYEAGGKTYHTMMDTESPKRLLDDAREPIIYDPAKPRDSILLDDLPAEVEFDDMGNLRHRHAFMGYLYPLIPVAVITWMVAWTIMK